MLLSSASSLGVFPFMVSTLPGWPDVSLLRAVARAEATAILNLEGIAATEAQASLRAVLQGTLQATAQGRLARIGVRLDRHANLDAWPADLIDAIAVAIIQPGDLDETTAVVARLQSASRQLLLECTSIDDAHLGAALQVDGLIAKGHETGGWVGDETTFVLVQRLLSESTLPVWAQGGIGRHTVGACFVAGCAGVVLDVQFALTRESTLPDAVKAAIARMGGDETLCLGTELGQRYRVYSRPGLRSVADLQGLDAELAKESADAEPVSHRRWRDSIAARVNWRRTGDPLWPLGQDAALAAPLARQFQSVSGTLHGLRESLASHVEVAREMRTLDRGAPLAVAHGTEYPILQGPMTRVSDTAGFAAAVAEAGGLPFLAFALLRAPQLRTLLQETKELLGNRPWGAGILGFVPLELREEQLRVLEEFAPPFALIAGGRPDQATKLEKQGIPTYLHVPAPSLLRMFLDDGARRFIFEGRECGGHVGPRTSFVLWESMVDVLAEAIERGVPATEIHAIFAGGIHDARSAAMAATIGAPLAKLGVRIGVLMGTAYLFTEEAVATGAIVGGFQQEALHCSRTVLLESGPGHATRCAETPFFDTFRQTRRRLVDEGGQSDEIRLALETLNLGRLRIASKGIARASGSAPAPERSRYVPVADGEQRQQGMYMIGQVAALRDRVCHIAELHHDVSVGGMAVLQDRALRASVPASHTTAAALSSEIAIVGMGCILPKAANVRALWGNILGKVDAIGEVPPERFDVGQYYDADRQARDKIYSKWGGFLDEVPFDPMKFGIPPAAVPSIDPFQLLTLEVVQQALNDAGYGTRAFNRDRTSVILGASGGVGDLGFRYGVRAGLPMFMKEVPEEMLGQLPEWTEDSFAGVLLNVAAGRVANRFNLGGLNFTVDAACASSLAAIYVAARELESGASDMAIVGGIDTVNSPFGFLCFSSAQALSPTGHCRTFDESADGIAISEGLVMLVLKRRADAERDGDRIYSVIRAVAGSSDGRGKGLTAPKPEGQMRVLERAYEVAGFSPSTVGLVEAHGTGTVAGDTAEVSALSRVFGAAGTAPQTCALGSIKSMIGHTKSAAGVSGILKVSLALHHKILPPTLHVAKPNAKLRETASPFFVNTEAQPWMASSDATQPRRAAVSSFGFGGTNFHVLVEEYGGDAPGVLPETATTDVWPAELAFWTSTTPQLLVAALTQLEQGLTKAPDIPLRDIAAALGRGANRAESHSLRLAIVATSIGDLRGKIATARAALEAGRTELTDPRGVFLAERREPAGKVAFLFPGQGSQYPGMHRDLAVHFSDVRHSLEIADRVTARCYPRPLSSYVFPPPPFSKEQEDRQTRELTDTVVAQPALGAVEYGLCRLLDRLGVRPDVTAGHSYGEYVALSVAGAFSPEVLFAISEARGRSIATTAGSDGTMAAVNAPAEAVAQALGAHPGVWIANLNSPRQTVVSGRIEAVEAALQTLSICGLPARRIPVACAFHSPLMQAAGMEMAALLAETPIAAPRIPVFSNALATPYPSDPGAIKQILADHLTSPVRFSEQIDAMHRAGVRIFVEVGPRTVLANLVRDSLSSKNSLVVSIDAPDRNGVAQLLQTIAQLAVAGVNVDFDDLWRGRSITALQIAKLPAPETLPAHLWMVSGGRSRRQDQPKHAALLPAATAALPSKPAAPAPLPLAATSASTAQVDRSAPTSVGPNLRPRIDARQLRQAPLSGLSSRNGESMNPEIPTALQPFVPHTNGNGNSNGTGTGGHSEDVMRQFQELMSQFLQTQALVMTAYLQGAPASAGTRGTLPVSRPMPPSLTPVLSRSELGRTEMSRTEPSRTELNGAEPAPHHPAPRHDAATNGPNGLNGLNGSAAALLVPAATQVVPPVPAPERHDHVSTAPGSSAKDVLAQLLQIVGDRTGYPEEMLDVDVDIEADLGIDSIKRMEVLTAFQQLHAGTQRGVFQGAMEKLTALKTLRETANALTNVLTGQSEAAATA